MRAMQATARLVQLKGEQRAKGRPRAVARAQGREHVEDGAWLGLGLGLRLGLGSRLELGLGLGFGLGLRFGFGLRMGPVSCPESNTNLGVLGTRAMAAWSRARISPTSGPVPKRATSLWL